MRLFVGLWPSRDVCTALKNLDRSSPAVRWVAPENWHVTLRFLGEMDEAVLPELNLLLAEVASQHSFREARMGPVTQILSRRVLVAPVAGTDDLGKAVIEATAGLGRPPDTRPFTGHLTLARAEGRAAIAKELAGESVRAAWPATEIALIRSTLGRAGSVYDTISTFGLAGTG